MRVLIFLLFLNLAKLSSAQNMEKNYLGALILSNNSTTSFSIHFNEENGVVNGYTLTNIDTPDETKSFNNGEG